MAAIMESAKRLGGAGDGPGDPTWDVGDRVLFLDNNQKREYHVIVRAQRVKEGEWQYDVEDEGTKALVEGVSQTSLVAPKQQ